MIEYTKPLNIKGKVRKGTTLPEGSVEVCKFNNNINKARSANKITSSSEKNLSQAKLGKAFKVLKDKKKPDDNLFSKETEYKDDSGYAGVIPRRSTEWRRRVAHNKKYYKVTETNEYSSYLDVPRTIEKEIDGHKGTMHLTGLEVLKENKTTGVKTQGKEYRTASQIMLNTKKEFPSAIFYNKDGFEGTLALKEIVKMTNQKDCTPTTHEIISDKVNGSFPPQIEKDGIIYYPTGEYVDKVVDCWVKHYGICRYWGGGGARSNNYYGDADYRYNVDGWTAKGHFTDAHPDQLLHRWDHWIGKACKHNPEKYPVDIGGYWDKAYGEYSGIKWTYDIEEAKKYGGLDREDWGGIVWASDYWEHSGGVFPPPGYENDYLGNSHVSKITNGNNGSINHESIHLCVKNGPQRTSAAGFYNQGGWYCKHFRDVIAFYKGKTTKKISQAKYKGVSLKSNGWVGGWKAIYVGNIGREVSGTKDVISSRTLKATYEGILTETVITYDGMAYYEGIVYKKIFVDPTITPDDNKVVLVVNSDGYLSYDGTNKTIDIKSARVNLTNVSKEGVPLMYTCKLKNKLYLPNGPKTSTILDANYIGLKYDRNIIDNIVYLIKLTPFENNYYTAEVLVNKLIGCTENVHAYFATYNSKIADEQLSAEYIYRQGIHFNAEDISSTANDYKMAFKYKFGNSSIKQDTRRKVSFKYKVKTIDGKYESKTYDATIINKDYALESEKLSFLGDKMCISPELADSKMTAKEMVASNSGLDVSKLKDCKFIVELLPPYNHNVDPYTDIFGNGYVYASTYDETGYPVNKNGVTEYTGKEKDFFLASSINDIIYHSFYVELVNQEGLKIEEPYNTNDFANWYPRIKYFPFTLSSNRNDTDIMAYYKLKEYNDAKYHTTLLNPYKTFREKALVANEHTIKVSRNNVLFSSNENREINKDFFRVYEKDTHKNFTVIGFDIKTSTAITKEILPKNKTILCEYVYAEDTYEYSGYSIKDMFYLLDMNPNKYHSYRRLDNASMDNSYNLFNKTVYIFLKPSLVRNNTTNEVIEKIKPNEYSLYHKFDDPEPDGVFDLLIGIVSLTPLSSILNTTIENSDIVGGGIKERYIDINKDSLDGFFDIDIYNEKAIQRNGTIVIKTDDTVSKIMSDDEIIETISEHKPVGILPIIQH